MSRIVQLVVAAIACFVCGLAGAAVGVQMFADDLRGPAGPQGPAGPEGPVGQPGPPGPRGERGISVEDELFGTLLDGLADTEERLQVVEQTIDNGYRLTTLCGWPSEDLVTDVGVDNFGNLEVTRDDFCVEAQ